MNLNIENLTINQVMMEKFRQSCDRFGDDRHAVMRDCDICQATYYRYVKILNLRNSDNCDDYDIEKDESGDTIPA